MERNCEFMTVVTTGEQPDAEFHMIAFEEKDGIQVQGKQSGNMRVQAMLVASVVRNYCKDLKKEQGVVPCAAFVCAVGQAMLEGGGEDVMKMASVMSAPEKMVDLMAEALSKMVEEEE